MNTIFLRRVNVGQDATAKELQGQRVIEFSVADNKKFKDAKGEAHETTTWYRCSFWTNANLQDFLKKGAMVNVIGQLSAGAYSTKQGQPAVDLKVTVREIDLLSTKEETKTNQEPQREASDLPPVPESVEDDMIF